MNKLNLCAVILIFSLTACAEESNSSKDADMTGNRFADAAATKVMSHQSGFTRKKANCVVKTMTADGKYGLGEINQMKLNKEHFSENASGLAKAYVSAVDSCK